MPPRPEVAVGLARSCEVSPEWSEGGCHFSAGKWGCRELGCPRIAVFVSVTTVGVPAGVFVSTAMLTSAAATALVPATALAPALAKMHTFATALPLEPAVAIVYAFATATVLAPALAAVHAFAPTLSLATIATCTSVSATV